MAQTASTNPENNTPSSTPAVHGLTKDNKIITSGGTFAPELAEFQREGLTEEAAIAKAVDLDNQGKLRQKKASITSEPARKDIKKATDEFEQMTTRVKRSDYADEQSYQNALARSKGEPEPFQSYAERTKKQPEVAQVVEGEVVQGQITDPSIQAVDEEINLINDTYNSYLSSLDTFEQQQIKDIQQEYTRLRRDMERTNEIMQNTTRLSGARTGRQRYAPEIQGGILQAEINAGQQRISDLIQEEQSLINQAKQAMQQQRWGVFKDALNMIRGARQEKSQAIQQHKDNILKQAQEERNKMEFIMNLEKHYADADRAALEDQVNFASIIAPSLVTLDEDSNVVVPTDAQINEYAISSGIDPVTLKSQVQLRVDELRKQSVSERQVYYNQMMQQNQALLAERKFEFEQEKEQNRLQQESFMNSVTETRLGLDLAKFDMTNERHKLEMEQLQQEIAQSANGYNMSAGEINDAIEKGYETEAQLKIYAQIKAKGGEPTSKVKKSAEQKKLEGNIMSGLDSIALLRENVKNQLGRGKSFDTQYKFAEKNVKDVLVRLRTGAAITPDEEEYYNSFLPKLFQTDTARLNNLQRLENIFLDIIGRDTHEQRKRERYADVNVFEQMGNTEEKKEFVKFLEGVDAQPDDDISEYFKLFRAQKFPDYEAYNESGFNQDLSTSLKGSDVSNIKDWSSVETVIGKGTATGIEKGSDYWEHGFDFVLSGGKGAEVPSPFSGEIITASKGYNGGFGNQVKIKLDSGEEIWLSHLDDINVKKGQRISQGEIIGKQGNTGNVIKSKGGTGTHLDITMKKPDGSYYTSQEVASLLNTKLV